MKSYPKSDPISIEPMVGTRRREGNLIVNPTTPSLFSMSDKKFSLRKALNRLRSEGTEPAAFGIFVQKSVLSDSRQSRFR